MPLEGLHAAAIRAANPGRELLWAPSAQRLERTRMMAFARWLAQEQGLAFASYTDLWRWSVDDLDGFWDAIWRHFDVVASSPPGRALANSRMPDAEWFPGVRLNWAQNLLRHDASTDPAIVAVAEGQSITEMSWAELTRQVASLAAELRALGVAPGDRVAAYLPNLPETVVAILAVASVGAIWSCCAPDFGHQGVVARFRQIEPVILIASDGYRFGGCEVDRLGAVAALRQELPTVREVVLVRNLAPDRTPPTGAHSFDTLVRKDAEPRYEQVAFGHPLWILFSSGTTGPPKGIVHSHGGILLEALKANALHYDIHPGDRLFIAECGLPPGVLNVVTTSNSGEVFVGPADTAPPPMVGMRGFEPRISGPPDRRPGPNWATSR